ncbi:MAG: hypothetical protein JWQ72_3012 [Polaromonas sp.]|nr:hypothetical protein [Polaromonas sp.]
MKTTLISLAVLAFTALHANAFAAADKPGAESKSRTGASDLPGLAKPLVQNTTPPKTNTPPPPPPPPSPLVPTLLSATPGAAQYKALDNVSLAFAGINLSAASPTTSDCIAKVNWGDGSSPEIYVGQNGKWLTLNHVYASAGTKSITVAPKSFSGAACVGGPVTASVQVNPPTPLPPSMMTQLVVTPMVNPKARLISTKWVGSAPNSACSYILHFGDGASKKTGAGTVQPGSDEQHIYAAGTYSVIITPSNADYDSCTLGPNAGPKTFTVE